MVIKYNLGIQGSEGKTWMKYKCLRTTSCKVCKRKGTIQAFLNSRGYV